MMGPYSLEPQSSPFFEPPLQERRNCVERVCVFVVGLGVSSSSSQTELLSSGLFASSSLDWGSSSSSSSPPSVVEMVLRECFVICSNDRRKLAVRLDSKMDDTWFLTFAANTLNRLE